MSDPNVPRRDDQHEPTDPSSEGFSVTDEQHAAPSAPAAPALGQPAEPFSAPAGGAVPSAPGQPAFDSDASRDWSQPQPGQQGSAPFDQPGYGQGGYAQPGYGQPGGQQHGAPQYGSPQYGSPQYGSPQYGSPQHGAPQYGAPGQPQYAAGAPMSPVDEKNAGMWGHLSGLSTIVTGGWGGWIGPLIVFLIYKDRSAFARQESKEALNFGIFMTILTIGLIVVGTILSFVGIGFLLLMIWWVPGLLQVIFSIIGGVRVNAGGSYRYPFNWRLVK
ncbi:DUF4870 domain-containing protein [Agrococcus sp. TF02-05]|uniref:DUF4870 domain-containing protein n=1 Tax=Agrococcus sp. TF02-05 TaxID=2815211 RepID=UPI001AA16C64|nr:DUF4870 domain-containing protein [Agrococcus sp. TF02-05]MBO1768961.1 DUF4870 domain-containing protein [Agrococcus sp. TF02-05]